MLKIAKKHGPNDDSYRPGSDARTRDPKSSFLLGGTRHEVGGETKKK